MAQPTLTGGLPGGAVPTGGLPDYAVPIVGEPAPAVPSPGMIVRAMRRVTVVYAEARDTTTKAALRHVIISGKRSK